jgi:hypothetical protein
MPAPSAERKSRSLIDVISEWWSSRTIRSSALSELECAGTAEVERIAKDVGVSAPELRNLISRGPDAANLLLLRMAALKLDRSEVARNEPAMFQDLQRVCSMCQSKRQCRRDLARGSPDPEWEDYCPNVATLKALDALLWLPRRAG